MNPATKCRRCSPSFTSTATGCCSLTTAWPATSHGWKPGPLTLKPANCASSTLTPPTLPALTPGICTMLPCVSWTIIICPGSGSSSRTASRNSQKGRIIRAYDKENHHGPIHAFALRRSVRVGEAQSRGNAKSHREVYGLEKEGDRQQPPRWGCGKGDPCPGWETTGNGRPLQRDQRGAGRLLHH